MVTAHWFQQVRICPAAMSSRSPKRLYDCAFDQRLLDISAILDGNAVRDFGEFWIRQDAAQELLGLLSEAQNARFSFPASLRPALLFAVDRKAQALPTFIEYSGWEQDGRLLQICCNPRPQHQHHDFEPLGAHRLSFDVELVMPPFGLDMAR